MATRLEMSKIVPTALGTVVIPRRKDVGGSVGMSESAERQRMSESGASSHSAHLEPQPPAPPSFALPSLQALGQALSPK